MVEGVLVGREGEAEAGSELCAQNIELYQIRMKSESTLPQLFYLLAVLCMRLAGRSECKDDNGMRARLTQNP